MKTQNNKLAFKTNSIVELNDSQLLEIDGGLTPTIIAVSVASSAGCAATGGLIVGAIVASIWA